MDQEHLLNGWPLGLEVMNTRLRMAEPDHSLPPRPTPRPTPPFANLLIPSTSTSSFSSSELDTVSTASFFQDHSVSLGRLIGIRPADKTWLHFPTDECESESVNSARLDATKSNITAEISERICIPIVIGIILKMIRNRRNSRS